jgi:uncharacterized membrane protein
MIGGIFILAGLLHFIKPGMYISIMPDYIPYHKAMVLISGIAEVLGGIGMMISPFREYAAFGLILLLVAVFPANIDMALKGYKNHGLTLYTWILLGRLPLQFLLIYWVYWAGIK